jgi:hypothetical protein
MLMDAWEVSHWSRSWFLMTGVTVDADLLCQDDAKNCSVGDSSTGIRPSSECRPKSRKVVSRTLSLHQTVGLLTVSTDILSGALE